jgi:hypothetical protein
VVPAALQQVGPAGPFRIEDHDEALARHRELTTTAFTFFAIYRQLSIARSASAYDQLTRFEREWTSERMLHHS